MTLHMLGRDAEAEQALSEAQQLAIQARTWQEEVEVVHLIGEAEAMLGSAEVATPASEIAGQ